MKDQTAILCLWQQQLCCGWWTGELVSSSSCCRTCVIELRGLQDSQSRIHVPLSTGQCLKAAPHITITSTVPDWRYDVPHVHVTPQGMCHIFPKTSASFCPQNIFPEVLGWIERCFWLMWDSLVVYVQQWDLVLSTLCLMFEWWLWGRRGLQGCRCSTSWMSPGQLQWNGSALSCFLSESWTLGSWCTGKTAAQGLESCGFSSHLVHMLCISARHLFPNCSLCAWVAARFTPIGSVLCVTGALLSEPGLAVRSFAAEPGCRDTQVLTSKHFLLFLTVRNNTHAVLLTEVLMFQLVKSSKWPEGLL